MGKKGSVSWLLLWWSLLGLYTTGCSQTKRQESSPPPSPVSAAPEKTKVVVLRLENATKKGKADNSTGEDRLLGNGLRVQIVHALEQTGRFTVVSNTGPRQVLQRAVLSDSGDIKGSIRDRLGSLGDAEFLVAGVLTTYQLSKESKKAGIDADLLLRQSQVETVGVDGAVGIAKKTFESLKPQGSDRVMVELWLFDAKTGKRLAVSRIEGTGSDTSEPLTTPMQQAVRGSANKAVNWIVETQAAFRAGTLTPPAILETKKPPLPEPKPQKVSKTRQSKPASVQAPPEEKSERTVEAEVENTPPSVAKTPEVQREDWGSPPSQAVRKVDKTPTQSAEEWGEQ